MSEHYVIKPKVLLPLQVAEQIIDGALSAAKTAGLLPLTVAVLDVGGHLIAFKRQDGTGILRGDIAIGKAWGALGMGVSSRHIRNRLADLRACRIAVFMAMAALGIGSYAGAVSACLPTDAGQTMKPATADAPFAVALKLRPALIKVGAPFTADLVVCSASGTAIERLVVDATMPAHRHGMNYKPEIVARADGRYEVRNFLFHMPGAWQFAVSVYSAGKPTHLTLGIDVK